ncbi:hypothetical protein BT63DRAFT_205989 [Microthyrium microscopicum]|uniref:Uncharacterized protein n=1 Tax=Microthyrium microscopicum TaxID=703497 RepID=A0A6A6UHT8_9PEZI|nr:hypothetical protein BT63DRAFT_205989 [Microthyrium microscopicum]
MDSFILRKRRRVEVEPTPSAVEQPEDSTDFKLAVLSSLHPAAEASDLLEALLAAEGSVEYASDLLKQNGRLADPRKRIKSSALGNQSSLSDFSITSGNESGRRKVPLTRRGKTLHLYTPEDIEEHTPCTIIHNFLPAQEAEALLRELLPESCTYEKSTFKLFDRVVESPHTMRFYVDSWDEAEKQKTEYVYDGSKIEDVRKSLPEMLKVSAKVKETVNREVQRRIKEFYPNGEKLKYQSPDEWLPNCSFVNCYDGPQESVGYHADQLTYLGPRAIIGSLSLGVAREFRVRRVVARDEETTSASKATTDRADTEGQIAIHLPHNSLLIMHAEMQEEWNHSIAPAQVINPHPIAGNKRLNITYRCYKDFLHPKYTPRCKCNVPCVLRSVRKRKENRGKYTWTCHAHYVPGQDGCSYFQWAEFDDDGYPPWVKKNIDEKKPMNKNVG